MKNFYFDTADVSALKSIWGKLKSSVRSELVCGVTTNPAIMNRAGKNSLSEWLDTYKAIYETTKEINPYSELHVQFPNSHCTIRELERFIEMVFDLGLKDVVFKVAPYSNLVDELGYSVLSDFTFNVTGLSEAGTILKVSGTHNIQYASIIPGRMIPAGLDYEDHIKFASCNSQLTIIAGALRNFEQLSKSFLLGAVPTIGLKTFDVILDNNELDKLLALNYEIVISPDFMPPCDSRNTDLSKAFFTEMDQNGAQAYSDFLSIYK
jgi:hypothetical protein